MTWYGWSSIASHDMACWYGMVVHGVKWYGIALGAWHGMAGHGNATLWYGMAWYGTAWYGMASHGKHDMAWHGLGLHGLAWRGTGMTLHCMALDVIDCCGMV